MNTNKHSQLILSSISQKGGLDSDSFTYQSIFLSLIVPDDTNARFLPAILMEDADARLFTSRKISKKQLAKKYKAEDYVLIGKSCIINCLKYGSNDWKKANKTIESIMELGNNISVSELIQAPTVFPIEDGKFQVLTGHRRYFALVYANGYSSAAQFKVYESRPLLTKIKQFQENASRDELPQYGKLQAFESALSEIEMINSARQQCGQKRLTVKEIAANLGISMGAYDNYNVLTRYLSVLQAYEQGLSLSFVKAKKLVLEVESGYKKTHDKKVLNVTDKRQIDKEIKLRLLGENSVKRVSKSTKPEFKLSPKMGSQTIKAMLTSNIMELDVGVDWHQVDWQDNAKVSEVLATVIDYFDQNVSMDS